MMIVGYKNNVLLVINESRLICCQITCSRQAKAYEECEKEKTQSFRGTLVEGTMTMEVKLALEHQAVVHPASLLSKKLL